MKLQKVFLFSILTVLSFTLVLYLKNHFFAVRISDGIGTLWIDYFGFTFILLSLLFFSKSLTFIFSFFFLINIFNSLMLFSNRIYYRYFGDYITVDIFSLAQNIPFTWRNILNLIKFKDLCLFFDLPFLAIALVISVRKLRLSLKRSFLLALIFLLVGISLTGLNLLLLHRTLPYVLTFRYGSSMLFNSMSVHNFYILNFFQERIKKEEMVSPPSSPLELISNSQELDQKFKIKSKLWNIIIVEFESLGAEVIGRKIEGQEITPTLNRLSEKGIYFSNFYSQALTCSGTLDVEFSTLASLYPSPKSPYAIKFATKVQFTLPKFLKKYGYKTMFFHANRGDFYRRSTVMRIFGFDELYFSVYFLSKERRIRGISDYPFFLGCAEAIKKSSRPFFAYLVTLSSHTPFELPEGEKPGLKLTNNLDENTKKYYQIINYSDRAFRAFLDELNKESILEDTILILFGDHPRAFLKSEEGEIGIVREIVTNKIPLIILIPNAKRAIVDEPASHIDISPTILSILGLRYKEHLLGRNLLSGNCKGFVLINRNPVILIKEDNVLWGYLEKGFKNCLNKCSESELSESKKFLEIIKYSEYVLKK